MKLEEYVRKNISEEYNSVSVWFENEDDKVFEIGEKMNEINENAYMNGYNWDAFFNYYLAKYTPDVLVGLDSDPEAGSYVAHYELTPENEARADKFIEIIKSLIENEEELYRIVREEGDDIEWD
jgi:hypothetical protein